MRRIAVVTGTRAEWGLLRPVCEAIGAERALSLHVVAGGAHMLAPARTIDEVRAFAPGLSEFSMQVAGEFGRSADARALGRGIVALSDIFSTLAPDVVVVLGDRIDAFAAACAAAVGEMRVAHIHGGEPAEDVDIARGAVRELDDAKAGAMQGGEHLDAVGRIAAGEQRQGPLPGEGGGERDGRGVDGVILRRCAATVHR